MYTAKHDGTETKVFYNNVHVETWNKARSHGARDIFHKHYACNCKCVDCVAGAAVNKYYNIKQIVSKLMLYSVE